MRILVLLLFASLGSMRAQDFKIKVRLFSTMDINKATVTPDTGLYYLVAMNSDLRVLDTIYDIYDQDSIRTLYFEKRGNSVSVKRGSENLGVYSAVRIVGTDSVKEFKIEANNRNRWYQDDLQIRVHEGHLQVVNIVDLEKYVAGVVESESGHVEELEFYKAQAIIARTFALKNYYKHMKDGYSLTDDVTSQVYFSKCHNKYSDLIWEAVESTRDTIVVTSSCHPILCAFHANSGGQTVGSEAAWMTSIEYLKPVMDTFSIGVGSYSWEKRIPKNDFYGYIAKSLGVTDDIKLRKALLNFRQENRQAYFSFGGKKLKLTKVRFRFDLRSTNFVVTEEGNYVVLNGKGYGHGVGLSQDGAVEMSRRGYDHKEIINFYYQEVEFENYLHADLN